MSSKPTRKTVSTKRSFSIFLAIAAGLFGLVLALPTPEAIQTGEEAISLTVEGKASLAVLLFAVLLWMTEAGSCNLHFPSTTVEPGLSNSPRP